MKNQDEGLTTSDIGLLLLIIVTIWFWLLLR